MSIRWLLYRGLIDAALARAIPAARRKQVLRNMIIHEWPWRQAMRSARVPLIGCFAFVVALVLIREWALRSVSGPAQSLFLLIMPIGLFGFFLPWIARERNRRPFLLSLRDFGYEVCPDCGYWLRGLDQAATKCSECGAPREPMPDLPLWAVTREVSDADQS